MKFTTVLIATIIIAWSVSAASRTLDIYFIDVEGGQSTLLVTPAGQSLLIDAGFAGVDNRDPKRIMTAVRQAGLRQIDYLLITHFHPDHAGGVAALVKMIPIQTFIDAGPPVQLDDDAPATYRAYTGILKNSPHIVAKAGDRLPLKGIDVDVMSAAGTTRSTPVSGAGQANPACTSFEKHADDQTENPRSLGILIALGAFRFLDLGDLNWNKLGELVCPNNLVGKVDLYLVPHHANVDTNVPEFLSAVWPRVVIINNGATKGGSTAAMAALHHWPGIEDVWQLHRSENNGVENSTKALIANLDQGPVGYMLKVKASEDGSFSVTNTRTTASKRYPAHSPR